MNFWKQRFLGWFHNFTWIEGLNAPLWLQKLSRGPKTNLSSTFDSHETALSPSHCEHFLSPPPKCWRPFNQTIWWWQHYVDREPQLLWQGMKEEQHKSLIFYSSPLRLFHSHSRVAHLPRITSIITNYLLWWDLSGWIRKGNWCFHLRISFAKDVAFPENCAPSTLWRGKNSWQPLLSRVLLGHRAFFVEPAWIPRCGGGGGGARRDGAEVGSAAVLWDAPQ